MLTKAQVPTLTEREIEQYRELGYLVVADVFDAGLLAEIRGTPIAATTQMKQPHPGLGLRVEGSMTTRHGS